MRIVSIVFLEYYFQRICKPFTVFIFKKYISEKTNSPCILILTKRVHIRSQSSCGF